MGQSLDKAHDLYPIKVPVMISSWIQVALLYEIDKFTRGLDARVKNVFVSLASEYKVILVASSHGLVVEIFSRSRALTSRVLRRKTAIGRSGVLAAVAGWSSDFLLMPRTTSVTRVKRYGRRF